MSPLWVGAIVDLFARMFGRACEDQRRADYQRRLRALRKIIDENEKKKGELLRELRQAERRLESLYDRSRRVALRKRALDPNPYGRADDDTTSISTDECEYIEDATPCERPSHRGGPGDPIPGQ